MLIAATLAPTDAALGQPVLTTPPCRLASRRSSPWHVAAQTPPSARRSDGRVSGGVLLSLAEKARRLATARRPGGQLYLVAAGAGGNGFIAAFVGLAFGAAPPSAERFTETRDHCSRSGLGRVRPDHLRPATASVVLRRSPSGPEPHDSACCRSRRRGSRGRRCSASGRATAHRVLRLEASAGRRSRPSGSTAWTVLLSVVAHGLSAAPLSAR